MSQTSKLSWSMRVLGVVGAVVLGAPVLAQGARSDEKSAPALAGPKIGEKPAPASVGQTDFNGEVRRPESTPEEAIVLRLVLTDETRARVKAILDERERIIDTFVVENVDLLTKLGAAGGTNDKLDQLLLLSEAFQKLKPVWKDGPLNERIEAALPAETRGEFRAQLKAYWDAIVAEGRSKGDPKALRLGLVTAEKLQSFGKEIERSFQRQYQSGQFIVAYLTNGLDLSPTQRARANEITLRFMERTGMKANDDDQGPLAIELASILTPEQREVVFERVKGLNPKAKVKKKEEPTSGGEGEDGVVTEKKK